MYHRPQFQTLLAQIALVLTLAGAPLPALADATELSVDKSSEQVILASWPIFPAHKDCKVPPTAADIYEYDKVPLGNRSAILMVHGLRGEFGDCFRWRKVCEFLERDTTFKSRYKIYLLRYNSYIPIDEARDQFKVALASLYAGTGRKPIPMVALSMGGNIIARAMTDATVAAQVERVMALGTPFHGSPLFSKEWMAFSMLKHHPTPLGRLDTYIPYKIYFSKHENLLTDLHWDNSDKMIPDVGKFRFFFPVPTHGKLTATSNPVAPALEINSGDVIDKSKFIVYGAYLETDFAADKPPAKTFQILKSPYWFATTILPEHLGREHSVLRNLNLQIARAIPAGKTGGKTLVYGLNDGITPLSSSLFLPNSALALRPIVTAEDLSAVKPTIDVRKARVFRNIDHVSFIDEYLPRGRSEDLHDELSPNERARPIFAWILSDIVGGDPTVAESTTETDRN